MPNEHFEFFPGSRRKVELDDWRPLLNAQAEKRLRLDFLMPLTGQALVGIPKFVGPSYEVMDKEGSAAGDIDLEAELEGVTVQAFSTDSNKHPIEIDTLGLELVDADRQLGSRRVLVTGATVRNFKLVRETREKVALVCLRFSVTVKAEAGLVLWAHSYHGKTFWTQFTETQPTNKPKKPDVVDGQLELKPEDLCPFVKDGMKCKLGIEHEGDHDLVPLPGTEPEKKAKRVH